MIKNLTGRRFFYHWLVVVLSIFIILAITFITGPEEVDTDDYTNQIEHFREPSEVPLTTTGQLKMFKPLYALISLIFPFLNPETLLLVVNSVFFVGTFLLFFLFLKELGFSEKLSLCGTVVAITSYPALLYGYALGTDVSGWFFFVTCTYLALLSFRKDKIWLLVSVSVLGFIGSLAKETGLLGLVFACVYALLHIKEWGWKKTFKTMLALAVPFIILEVFFLALLLHFNGSSFLAWFAENDRQYGESYRLKFLFGSEFSTFNFLWIYVITFFYVLFKKKLFFSKEQFIRLIALMASVLPVLLWPIFLDRVLYVQFVFIIPVALYGLVGMQIENQNRFVKCVIFAAPIIASVAILLVGGQNGLFELRHLLTDRFL